MPDITVTDIPPFNSYLVVLPMPGGATSTVLPFGFAVLNGAQVSVFATPAGALPNDAGQALIYGTDYSVQINPAPAVGGTVTLVVAAAINSRITIVRNTPAARTSAYSDGTLLSASVLNNDFNSTVMVEQEINRYTTMLCPHYNQTEITDPSDYVLPRLNAGQVWVKGILPGSQTAANENGTQGIIAESITNVLGGAPVALLEPPVTISALPVFADTSGNINGTGILVDATNNLTVPGNITVTGGHRITANNLVVSDYLQAHRIDGEYLQMDDVHVRYDLNSTGTTTLANTTINGTLNATGPVLLPGYQPAYFTATGAISTAGTMSAQAMLCNGLLTTTSANISGNLTVTGAGTTTIENTLIANNYSPANFTPVNINATGNISSGINSSVYGNTLIAGALLEVRNLGTISAIARAAGGVSHTLTLPNQLGPAGTVLSLLDANGTLGWTAGGAAGVACVGLPVDAGNVAIFSAAGATSITDSGVNIDPATGDMSIGGIFQASRLVARSISIAANVAGVNCIVTKANDGNSYGLALPPSGPTELNQPLVATSIGAAANCTLGWGDVYVPPARAFIKFYFAANGTITAAEGAGTMINMTLPTMYPAASLWSNSYTIQCNIVPGTFANTNYIVKIVQSYNDGQYTVAFLINEDRKTENSFLFNTYNINYSAWYPSSWSAPTKFIYIECT